MHSTQTPAGYGRITRGLHWLMAILVFSMFGIGYWMRTLSYYDPWYQRAPELHKSLGVILICLLVFRIIWRLRTPQPAPLSEKRFEQVAGHAVHIILYLMLIVMAITGYFFATGDGKPLSPFGLIDLPYAIKYKPLADFAGNIHEWLAYGVIGLALAHMFAALKHHFVDRNATLRRMIVATTTDPSPNETSKEKIT